MAAATKVERMAQFKVEKVAGKAGSTIKVSVPKGLKDDEFAAILKKIRGITACAGCASSGGHSVIFEPPYEQFLRF
jgi:hypothetical protein